MSMYGPSGQAKPALEVARFCNTGDGGYRGVAARQAGNSKVAFNKNGTMKVNDIIVDMK